MKTKEKLERAGWIYLCLLYADIELISRDNIRIIFDTSTDTAISYYDVTSNEPNRPRMISAYRLSIFCTKLNSG